MMRFQKLILVVLLAVLPLGCNSGGDKLRFWQFWDLAVIQPIIDEFERQNPDIEVEVEQLTWQSGLEKIQAAIASGTQPDLCELGSTWVPRFSYEGVLEDLTDVHASIADSFMAWDSAIWKERVYALPWVQGSRALFYNVDLFMQIGRQPQWAPKTWAELLAAVREIDSLGDDIYGFGLNLGERYILYKKFMPFAWSNGGGILSDDGKVIFDSFENLQAIDFYRELAKYSLKEKQQVLDHAFKEGRLGFQISGAWNIQNYAEEAPDLRYRVAVLPKPDFQRGRSVSFVGAEMLVLFKNTQKKEQALKLARFLQSYPQAKRLSEEIKSVFPASRRVISDPSFVQRPQMQTFVRQALMSKSAPAHPGWIDMEGVINQSIEEVLYGRSEPPQALHDAAKELEAIVERYAD